jgi:hypothetical protein
MQTPRGAPAHAPGAAADYLTDCAFISLPRRAWFLGSATAAASLASHAFNLVLALHVPREPAGLMAVSYCPAE